MNSVAEKGLSVLMFCSCLGQGPGAVWRLNFLLGSGANINHRDVEGDTALLNTIGINRIGKAALLLRRGADPALLNKWGQSILHYAAIGIWRSEEFGGAC